MKIWDCTQNKEIDAPWNVERFMEQVSRLCKEYNLSLAHEDRHGAFVIEEYKEENMRQDVREKIKTDWVFCDGGMGTILQAKGLKGGELPETWNLLRPQDILDLHCSYLNAGATIFNTNTFGANRLKYPDNLEDIVVAAVDLAKRARVACCREDDAYIALDIGPTGKLLEPLGDLPFDRAVELFAEVVQIGAREGADLVLIETMSDSYEAKAAVLAAKENCDLPVLITTIYDEKGKLLTGGTVASTVTMLEGLRVDALGVNCGLGPKQMMPIIRELTEIATVPIIVNPNAGLPRNENGATVFDVGPEEFATYMEQIASMGVHILGGCCGTTPEHIAATIAKVIDKEPVLLSNLHVCRISSYCEALEIGKHPLIIGERINPTGKKVFKQALRDQNFEYILSEGLRQEESGAHILDVNVGLPEIDEPAMMEEVVTRLQSITSLPLQIDTTDIEALERGLRYYNGKALINSVNSPWAIIIVWANCSFVKHKSFTMFSVTSFTPVMGLEKEVLSNSACGFWVVVPPPRFATRICSGLRVTVYTIPCNSKDNVTKVSVLGSA